MRIIGKESVSARRNLWFQKTRKYRNNQILIDNNKVEGPSKYLLLAFFLPRLIAFAFAFAFGFNFIVMLIVKAGK